MTVMFCDPLPPFPNAVGVCCSRPRVTWRPPESSVVVSQMSTVSPAACAGSALPVRRAPVRARTAELTSSRAGLRPAWILNVSNDAWFGQTSGPLQHLNIASYRAIEEGLPIVRATPTGVSAVIDAYGRVRPGARLGLGDFGVIDAPLPPALKPTPYVRWNDRIFGLMLLASMGVLVLSRVRRA